MSSRTDILSCARDNATERFHTIVAGPAIFPSPMHQHNGPDGLIAVGHDVTPRDCDICDQSPILYPFTCP